jgi:hypothetical protein
MHIHTLSSSRKNRFPTALITPATESPNPPIPSHKFTENPLEPTSVPAQTPTILQKKRQHLATPKATSHQTSKNLDQIYSGVPEQLLGKTVLNGFIPREKPC